MAFALLYELSDLQEIENRFTEARGSNAMTQAQRKRATDYWNAGLSTWRTATAPNPPMQGCPLCVAVVVNLVGGTKADFVALCRQIVARLPAPSVSYFNAIVDDMESAGIAEPWP